MKWLRRLLHRRIVRGFEHRMKSLQDLMTTCLNQKQVLYEKIENLGEVSHLNEEARLTYAREIDTWERMYWDAYNRHEEVESGLIWVTKDFDRR